MRLQQTSGGTAALALRALPGLAATTSALASLALTTTGLVGPGPTTAAAAAPATAQAKAKRSQEAAPAGQQTRVIRVKILGMSCPFCAYGVEQKLKKLDGVRELEVVLESGIATLTMEEDADVSNDTLKKTVDDAGFEAAGIVRSFPSEYEDWHPEEFPDGEGPGPGKARPPAGSGGPGGGPSPGVGGGPFPWSSPGTGSGGARHEPVFGIGPQTLWQGGVGAGLEALYSRRVSPDGQARNEEWELHAHADYGVTEDLTLRVAVPVVKRKTETVLVPGSGAVSSSATGVGDVMVRAKYRFWQRFSGSTQYHASVVGGAEFPSANSTSEPPLAPAGTDYLAGATVSRDGLRYYVWLSGIVRMNGGIFRGSRENEYRYDGAMGWRPWIPSFTGVDPLLLLELNGLTVTRDEPGEAGADATILAVSPAFWLTYRNYAFKGGVKLPVYQELGAEEKELDYTLVAEFEVHM